MVSVIVVLLNGFAKNFVFEREDRVYRCSNGFIYILSEDLIRKSEYGYIIPQFFFFYSVERFFNSPADQKKLNLRVDRV